MRLKELNPRFVGAGGDDITDAAGTPVPARHGVAITFDCPCGSEHCLRVCIEFANPLDGQPPHCPDGPKWQRAGDTFEMITLTPSIQRLDCCKWHGFVTNGEVHL